MALGFPVGAEALLLAAVDGGGRKNSKSSSR